MGVKQNEFHYIPITLDYFNPLETLEYRDYKDNKSYNIEINTVTNNLSYVAGNFE